MSGSRIKDIAYEVLRSQRTTADIVIERDGRVLVRAPKSIPDECIEDLIEAKRYWIYKNLAEWRDLNATRVLREYRNGEPLRDYETIVNLIARTTTAKGLKATCRLDRRKYPTGRRVSDEEMENINVERNKFHGDWNYIIKPKAAKNS